MLNKVMLIGRLGKDPETQFLSSGSQVSKFSMVTTEKWTKDGQKQEKNEWHNIVAWGKLAEICAEYLHKGSPVYIEGKISTRSWEDKEGKKRYMTEITANQLVMLGSKGKPEKEIPRTEEEKNPEKKDEDEIPF